MDRIATIEERMQRVAERLPGMPVAESLLCRVIIMLGRVMAAHVDEVISPYQLNDVEFRTLLSLFSQPDGTGGPSDLCAGLAQSPATMTRIGDVLVARNLVTRVPNEQDRRRMDIRITPQGEALVREVLPRMFDYTRSLYQDFSAAEKSRLLAALKKLFAQLTIGEDETAHADRAASTHAAGARS
ncbi:MAG TPA: MarR family transcriptional regulator [Steroidobacteraceae bacterium]|nr:MarR family transcriptional regulator [Steroidobacteraceae bacterium]